MEFELENEETPPDDELRGEYDRKDLTASVRAKYLERFRQGTNLTILARRVDP